MRLKFASFLIIVFFSSTCEIFAQKRDDIDIHLYKFKIPRCGELFPLSHYGGDMTLEKNRLKPLDSLSVSYMIYMSEKYLITDDETLGEKYSEYIQYSNTFSEISFEGNLDKIEVILKNERIITEVPQGKWKTHYSDSVIGKNHLIKIMNFEQGMVCGEYMVWDKDGNLLYQTVADTLGCWTMKDFFPSGIIRSEGEYLNGQRNGNWKWYDKKGRVTVEELYKEGKYIKKIIPYDIALNILINDVNVHNGYVIIQDDDHISTEPISWSNRNPILHLRDTIGINLYFCIYGHVPLLINLSELNNTLGNKKRLVVQPIPSVVYLGNILWTGYSGYPADPREVVLNHNNFNLPSQVSLAYNTINYKVDYPARYSAIEKMIPFNDIMPKLKKGENITLYIRISGDNKILKVSCDSENISSRRRLKAINLSLEYLQGKHVNMCNYDEYIYVIGIHNTIDYLKLKRIEGRSSYKQKGNYSGAPRFHTAIIVNVNPRDEIKGECDNIKRCDADVYMEDKTLRIAYLGFGLIFLFAQFISGFFADIHRFWEKGDTFHSIFVIISLSVPFCFILYRLLIPQKCLILNRKDGNSTIPRMFWRKSVTFPFVSGIAVITSVKAGSLTHRIELWPEERRTKGGILYTSAMSGTTRYVEEYWSFVVWYMDRNRPLPPGRIFDPFRATDFERRKSEGFPPPLYPSYIPTPEATPEQQKERGKVWKEIFK